MLLLGRNRYLCLTGQLQFSYSDRLPGIMPWSRHGESWICWRYPFSRRLANVLITLPPDILYMLDLELSSFSAEADSFNPVELQFIELRSHQDLPGIGSFDAGVILSLKVFCNSKKNIKLSNSGLQRICSQNLRLNGNYNNRSDNLIFGFMPCLCGARRHSFSTC